MHFILFIQNHIIIFFILIFYTVLSKNYKFIYILYKSFILYFILLYFIFLQK